MAGFMLVPALIMGGVIGLIELFFVHADEQGLGWLSHGFHTLPIAIILTLIAMNLGWAAGLVGLNLQQNFWVDLGLRIVVGLVATIKVKGAAAIVKGHNSVGEKLGHAFVIGALIAASPYIWGFITPMVPAALGGGQATNATTTYPA